MCWPLPLAAVFYLFHPDSLPCLRGLSPLVVRVCGLQLPTESPTCSFLSLSISHSLYLALSHTPTKLLISPSYAPLTVFILHECSAGCRLFFSLSLCWHLLKDVQAAHYRSACLPPQLCPMWVTTDAFTLLLLFSRRYQTFPLPALHLCRQAPGKEKEAETFSG